MKYDLWISITLSSQITDKVVDAGNIILPFYKLWECTDKLPDYKEYFVSLPTIVRNKDRDRIRDFLIYAEENARIQGVYVHNTETLGIIKSISFTKKVILGPGMYIWNNDSAKALLSDADKFVYPYELSKYELKEIDTSDGIITVYGRTPFMVTANCIRNTKQNCLKGKGPDFDFLKDRKGINLPIFFECESCYNVIYNSVATSLHEYADDIKFTKSFLLYFTNEEEETVDAIIDFYFGKTKIFPIANTTKAFFVHGVE